MELQQIERARPFSCGSQHADWESANCDRCTKRISDDATHPEFRCDIQRAVGEAYMTDGTVSQDIARRMGYSDPLDYIWQCAEVDWTPEWKAECIRRRTWRYRWAKWRWERKRAIRKWWDEKRQKLIQWWRMPTAERIGLDDNNDQCWAQWCIWALGYLDSEKPGPGSGKSCIEEGKCGSCWCGKYNSDKVIPAPQPAAGE